MATDSADAGTSVDMERSRELQKLKALQRGNRSAITRFKGEVTRAITEQTESYAVPDVVARLDALSVSLKDKGKYLAALHAKIVDKSAVEEIEREIEEFSSFEAEIYEHLEKIRLFKSGSYSRRPTTPVGNFTLNQNQEASSSPSNMSGLQGVASELNQSGHSDAMGYMGIKLPKISLPRFSGDVTKFTAFWQSFDCAVHQHSGLTSIQKLTYLVNLLEGPAKRALEGLDMTAGNYDSAIEILRERFGNKQLIINEHMNSLLKLQGHPNETINQLRFIFDKINVHVRGLESLGMPAERYGSLLIPIIMSRMPKEITTQVARKITTDVWPIEEILGIIRKEIEIKEFSDKASSGERRVEKGHNSRLKAPGTTQAFVARGKPLQETSCIYCEGNHSAAECGKVTEIKQRKDIVFKLRCCFVCLKPGHTAKACFGNKRCKHCGRKHHSSLCSSKMERPTEKETRHAKSVDNAISATARSKETALMMTATAVAYGEDESREERITILFESGSQRSYVTDRLKKRLNLKVDSVESLRLNTFGSHKYNKFECDSVVLNVTTSDGNSIPVRALSRNVLCAPLSTSVDVRKFAHLQDLELADCSNDNHKSIDLLIGLDYYFDFILGEVTRGGDLEPVAISSKLGWIITGKTFSDCCTNFSSSHLIIEGFEQAASVENKNQEILSTLKEFWEHEACGLHKAAIDDEGAKKSLVANQGSDDKQFDISFNGERYEVSLPFNSDSIDSLPSNYELCRGRLLKLYQKLRLNQPLLQQYDIIIKEQLDSNIIERVAKQGKDEDNGHYLPHHCVIRENHDTTKVRIVFDGSAKLNKVTPSLNDNLELGENHMPLLFNTILHFRSHPIALCADIEKAFHQISIKESDRDYLRFLWFQDVTKQCPEIIELRFCRLPFGLKSSPSILGATIKQHVSLFEQQEPQVTKVLKGLYADDLSCSVATTEEALQVYHKSKSIMSKVGFNLRKWRTNDESVLHNIQEFEGLSKDTKVPNQSQQFEDNETYARSSIGLPYPESCTTTKVLGVTWDSFQDVLVFDLSELSNYADSLPPTKRSLLKIAAKIFDPLGCLSPYTINLKVLFQQFCLRKLAWDDELQGPDRKKYEDLLKELRKIKGINVARSYFQPDKQVKEVQLHAFSDASENAYAAVVYLRVEYTSGEVDVKFVASKAKVCPLKRKSIPRLELIGAGLMAKLVHSVRTILEEELGAPISTYYWVDSVATLCWIVNEKPWKQFVRNRVDQIHALSAKEDWKYCPGSLNPADIPSRGKYGPIFSGNVLWFEGPEFLKSNSAYWPKLGDTNELEVKEAFEEQLRQPLEITHVMLNQEMTPKPKLTDIVDVNRFSSKGKLLRVVARVYRFIDSLRAKVRKEEVNTAIEVAVEEVSRAENELLKSIQSEHFQEELRYLRSNRSTKPPLRIDQLNLFVDENEVIRCRSRLNNASITDACNTPILLPCRHAFSELVINQAHSNVMHNGVRDTLNYVRQRYWILKGRETVKRCVRRCTLCKKFEGLPFKFNVTPVFPKERVEDCPPFKHIGVDFAGPLNVKGISSNSQFKSYIYLFTCATTRAIHLELVESLQIESFICAFRKFAARRGLPSTIISDNAKTFKAMSKEVRKLLCSKRFDQFLSSREIRWKFIADRSPWQGGMWERMVRSVKRCLVKVVGRALLSYVELSTILVEIEAVINARPLTYIFDDSEGLSYPLTPSHLINGRNLLQMPNDRHTEVLSTYETLSRRAKYHGKLLSEFSERWKSEYLTSLMEAYKQKQNSDKVDINVNDIVLLKDSQRKRGFWQLCKVVDVIEGRDGYCRMAKVQVPSEGGKKKVFLRSLKHLIPLEVTFCNQSAKGKSSANAAPLASSDALPRAAEPSVSRSRRGAAVLGEAIRRARADVE